LYCLADMETLKASIFRKEHFNAAHRLHSDNLSEDENKKVFGKCNNAYYHGHNYDLTVKVTGEINPITGYVIDTMWLKDIIQTQVIEKLDHKNLNEQVEEFKHLNPTVENIARVIYDQLLPHLPNVESLKIILYETERNYVEYPS
jgi:6-pyruvoyltetrahydropterin/6-carboxytetrahydropterin synthase